MRRYSITAVLARSSVQHLGAHKVLHSCKAISPSKIEGLKEHVWRVHKTPAKKNMWSVWFEQINQAALDLA